MGASGKMVRLHLVCLNPPVCEPGITTFGIQDRLQNVHPGQIQMNDAIFYEIDVPVKRTIETNTIRFHGPFVHGTPSIPFLYLSLKRLDIEPATWIKRLKIPLPTVSWDQLEATSEHMTFSASISGSGSGTVPILDGGWKW